MSLDTSFDIRLCRALARLPQTDQRWIVERIPVTQQFQLWTQIQAQTTLLTAALQATPRTPLDGVNATLQAQAPLAIAAILVDEPAWLIAAVLQGGGRWQHKVLACLRMNKQPEVMRQIMAWLQASTLSATAVLTVKQAALQQVQCWQQQHRVQQSQWQRLRMEWRAFCARWLP